MTTGNEILTNPYVGPRAFEQSESQFFFGRDQETEILTGLVMAHQASLFFAQSGAGKSSLLRAGLFPKLTRKERIGRGRRARLYQKMAVLPILMVGKGIPPQVSQPIANIYVFSALLSLLPEADPNDLADLTLADGLATLMTEDETSDEADQTKSGKARPPLVKPDSTLLIFDQFEELFTTHPGRWPEREGFFKQVNQAMARYPDLHVLFTMREDHIAELTPYANLLPENLRHRFRMERLQRDAALQAVKEPAHRAGRTFAENVAEDLVDNLRRTQAGRTIPNLQSPIPNLQSPQLGAYVEPVHLQIVCRQLWANLPSDRTTILAEDVEEFGDVDQALIGFYEGTLQEVMAQTDISQRRLRTWFDTQLVTPARTRGLVYRGEEETEGLPNAAIGILNEAYIIRADIRGGDTWYELAHDRLVEPILEANRAWQDKHQNPLTLAAEAWLASGKDSQKLYRGDQLKEAQEQAEANPDELTELEKEFISVSLETARLQAAKRQRLMLLGVGVLLVLFASLAGWALFSARQAAQQRAIAQAASTLAIEQKVTAEIASTAAIEQKAIAEIASTAAIEQKAIAEIASTRAVEQQKTAEAASSEAVIERDNAKAEATAAAKARADLLAHLEAQLTAVAEAARTPTPVPVVATPTPTGPFTPSPPAAPTSSPTPTPNQAATVEALQEKANGIRLTQTAVAMTPCPVEPEGEFRNIWDRYRGRLDCPIQITPSDGFFAEQPFENGYMFWSESPDLFVVTIGGDNGTWYLIGQSEVTWDWSLTGVSCEPDVPPGPGQLQPIRGFGGLWCAREDIREAIGYATAEEYGVGGNLLQEFEGGAILRDSNNFIYVLFRDDGTYIRERY